MKIIAWLFAKGTVVLGDAVVYMIRDLFLLAAAVSISIDLML